MSLTRARIEGREVCACTIVSGVALYAHVGCETCGGTGGVGADRPTKEEEAELWRGGWVASGPCYKVAGRWAADTETWSHVRWGVGRWRTALHLARDDARPRHRGVR